MRRTWRDESPGFDESGIDWGYADETVNFADDMMGLTEEELDQQCHDLFGSDAPIPFKPRKNDDMDQAIANLVDVYNVSIPVVHIKGKMYLIGT